MFSISVATGPQTTFQAANLYLQVPETYDPSRDNLNLDFAAPFTPTSFALFRVGTINRTPNNEARRGSVTITRLTDSETEGRLRCAANHDEILPALLVTSVRVAAAF